MNAGAVDFPYAGDACMYKEHTVIMLNINSFDIARCVIKATATTESKIWRPTRRCFVGTAAADSALYICVRKPMLQSCWTKDAADSSG